jgi:hypothetical protein
MQSIFIYPFDKEAERILKTIRKNGKAFTCDMGLTRSWGTCDMGLTRSWGKNYPELDDFIGVFNNRRRKESVFVPFPDVQIIERPSRGKNKRKFEIIKIF